MPPTPEELAALEKQRKIDEFNEKISLTGMATWKKIESIMDQAPESYKEKLMRIAAKMNVDELTNYVENL